jgi:hypothetical protein
MCVEAGAFHSSLLVVCPVPISSSHAVAVSAVDAGETDLVAGTQIGRSALAQ